MGEHRCEQVSEWELRPNQLQYVHFSMGRERQHHPTSVLNRRKMFSYVQRKHKSAEEREEAVRKDEGDGRGRRGKRCTAEKGTPRRDNTDSTQQ